MLTKHGGLLLILQNTAVKTDSATVVLWFVEVVAAVRVEKNGKKRRSILFAVWQVHLCGMIDSSHTSTIWCCEFKLHQNTATGSLISVAATALPHHQLGVNSPAGDLAGDPGQRRGGEYSLFAMLTRRCCCCWCRCCFPAQARRHEIGGRGMRGR